MTPGARAIAASLDGQWLAIHSGRQVQLHAAAGGAPLAVVQLDSDTAQIAFVGPPAALVVVTPDGVALFRPPELETIARVERAGARLLAITGPRFALVAPQSPADHEVTIVRVVERAIATQTIDVGAPIELAVGLDRNQLLFALPRALAVWDAASARPTMKLQLQLPPSPRSAGYAAGHLWAMHAGARELYIYRLSDGRPFQHSLGAAIDAVVSHPASPLVVAATAQGLARIHCHAHHVSAIDAPYQPGTLLAQLVAGDAITLVGVPETAEPWQVQLAGTSLESVAEPVVPAAVGPHSQWRETVAAYGQDILRGVEPPDGPTLAAGSEIAALAQRLSLGPAARRALVALYGVYLVGEPALAIARLARVANDWSEPLGQGELAALAMLRRKRGKVALRTAVTDLLDGAAPRAVRLFGAGDASPRPGAFRVSRDGRSDQTIETELASQLGRLAIATGPLARALLEARLVGATCVSFAAPGDRPHPWPRDASLVLVLYGAASSWVADLATL